MIPTTELIETYNRDGTISARGVGVTIKPQKKGFAYVVRTRIPGGSIHGTRVYEYDTYEEALDRALQWHTVTMPRRRRDDAREARTRIPQK